MPDIQTIASEAELFKFLCELENGEETFADYGNLSFTVAREETHGHIIVGTGKTRDGGGVIPVNFTLSGLFRAVRDLTYLSTLTIHEPKAETPR